MRQTPPSLTVLIPNYNHGHLIGEQLASVFSQSVEPTKIIIVDDASTDDSVSIIQRLISSQRNVEFLRREKNSGVVSVMNESLRLVATDYVTFLAADDMTLPGFFEKSLTLLARHPEAALCSGISYVQRYSGIQIWPDWTRYPCSAPGFVSRDRVREMFLRIESWIAGNTVIFRSEPLLALGEFDPKLRSFCDAFLYRVLALRHGVCFIPEPVGIQRPNDSGYSSSDTRDETSFEEIVIHSNARMTTDFADLFPVELIARNNARMVFRLLATKLANFLAHTRAVVEATQPMRGSLLLLFVVRWVIQILRLLFFCLLRFRDIPWETLSRLSRIPQHLRNLGSPKIPWE
jgi:glycosyltransferase involved in cell wall biosynthesis